MEELRQLWRCECFASLSTSAPEMSQNTIEYSEKNGATKPSSSKYAGMLQWHLDVERRTDCCNWKLPHRKLDMPVQTFT